MKLLKVLARILEYPSAELQASKDAMVAAVLEDSRLPRKNKEQLLECIDRKSTRLNSSHVRISYAVFCLKKKKKKTKTSNEQLISYNPFTLKHVSISAVLYIYW